MNILKSIDVTSITTLRRELQARDIDTATPGIRGETRRIELEGRLKDFLLGSRGGQVSHNTSTKSLEEKPIDWNSMVSIRTYLIKYGQSTSTPGLKGDDRQLELKKRLKTFLEREEEEKNDEPRMKLGMWNNTELPPPTSPIPTPSSPLPPKGKPPHENIISKKSAKLIALEDRAKRLQEEIEMTEKGRREKVFRRLSGAERTELHGFMKTFRNIRSEQERARKWKKRFIDSDIFAEAELVLGNAVQDSSTTRFHIDVFRSRLEEILSLMKETLSEKRVKVMKEERSHPLTGVIVQQEKEAMLHSVLQRIKEYEDENENKEFIQNEKVSKNSRKSVSVKTVVQENERKSGAAAVARRAATGLSDYSARKAMEGARKRLAARFNEHLARTGSARMGEYLTPTTVSRSNRLPTITDSPISRNSFSNLPPSRRHDFDSFSNYSSGSDCAPWTPTPPPPLHTPPHLRQKNPRQSNLNAGHTPMHLRKSNVNDANMSGQQAIVQYIVKKNIVEAGKIFAKALAKNPNDALLLHRYGNFLRDAKCDFENAAHLYRRASDAFEDGNNVVGRGSVLFDHAMLLERSGKRVDARICLQEAIYCNPNHAKALAKLAVSIHLAVVESGSRKATIESHRKASKELSMKKAHSLYERSMQANPEDPENLVNFALFASRILKDNAKAEKLFLKASVLSPMSSGVFSNFAAFLVKEKEDYDRAEIYYKRGCEVEENAACLGNYASFLYRVRKNTKRAEEFFRRALKVEPNHVNNLGRLASMLTKQKRYDDAEELYEKALAIGGSATMIGNMANFMKKVRKNSQRAMELYKLALKLDPTHKMNNRNYTILRRETPKV
eukprot:g1993.t1